MQQASTVIADGKYNAFPWCAQNTAGTILAVYREGASHISTDGKIALQSSSDGGYTWSAKSFIASPSASRDYRDPGICLTASGRLIVNFFEYDGTNELGVFTVHSDDGGTTWSALSSRLTPYTDPTRAGGCAGAILQHSSGELIMPVYGFNSGDTSDRMGVLRSGDDGATWGSLVNVSAQNGNFNEASMVELPDTTVQIYVRQETNPGPIYRATSSNVGVSWSALGSLGFNGTPGRPAAIIYRTGGSQGASPPIMLRYRSTTATSVYRFSTDLGATWGAETVYSGSPDEYAGGHFLVGELIATVAAVQVSGSRADVGFQMFALG